MRFIKTLFVVAVLGAVVVPNAMAFRFTDEARNTPTGVTGQFYSHKLSFAGGCNLVTVFTGPGSLPPGLRVVGEPRDDSQDGWRIEGTPTQAGAFTFWINARSGVPECQSEHDTTQEEWTMRIDQGLSIQGPAGFPVGTQNVAYPAQQLSATPGSGHTYTIASGALPAGLTLSPSGAISGTPTEVVQGKPVSIRASDSSGRSAVRSYELSIRAPLAVTVTPAQPPVAKIRTPFKFGPFVPTGGLGPYTLTLASGTLPVGLNLVPATAAIEGTPGLAGTFRVVVRATDAEGRTFDTPVTIQIASPVSIATKRFAALKVGRTYALPIKIRGGVFIVRRGQNTMNWKVIAGKLPMGLRMNGYTGKLIGKPRKAGTYQFTVQVTDKFKSVAFATYTVRVRP
jgi:hypothetical protein